MAIIADFMLVYLPAPTVSLRPPISVNDGSIAKFFYSCPDNAFQVIFSSLQFGTRLDFLSISEKYKLYSVTHIILIDRLLSQEHHIHYCRGLVQ